MAQDPLILYGEKNFSSPYVYSCLVALREKGVPFELRLLSLQDGDHQRGEYPDRSLTGRVPALQHGDFWLAESSAIDEYLEELFPPPGHPRLYPADPRQRARARQVQAWLRSDLVPIREERPTSSLFLGEPVKPLTVKGLSAADRLVKVVEQLLPVDGPWLFGAAFSIADADLALMVQRLARNGDPVPPRVRAWADAVWSRPSVQEFVNRQRPRAGA
jgi:glutathione S-transferase